MTGQPAARVTDKVVYGVIVTGSLTVHIGSQGGIACSVCPGGVKVANPVNPQLGAKVLLGEEDLDFALPGALPLIWQRQYSSYVNAEHGAQCGPLGYGWKLGQQIQVELRDEACLLFDAAGRVITFEALRPGAHLHSASESLHLMRGGAGASWTQDARWSHVPAALAANADIVFAASGDAALLWVFAALPTPAAGGDPNAPADGTDARGDGQPATARGQRLHLIAQIDAFGRTQRYEYARGDESPPSPDSLANGNAASPEPPPEPGQLLAIIDGIGRRYRLIGQRLHRGRTAQGPWGADDGWRLAGVEVSADPHHPLEAALRLVSYAYDAHGQLLAVRDRGGQLVREFEWQHHKITAHRHRGGPWHRYVYDSAEASSRVIAHGSDEGLSYRFHYQELPPSPEGKPRTQTRVTDSLKRTELYTFEGQAGLARLVRHQRADGSILSYRYDAAGALAASTDALERTTRLRRDADGRIQALKTPDGRRTRQHWDEHTGLLLQSEDGTGITTRYTYDAKRRLSGIERGGGEQREVERYDYPEPADAPLTCDQPLRIHDAQGGIKQLSYTAAGQLASYTDCSGQTTRYRYDRFGELLEVVDALGRRTRHERDAQGRIRATHLADGQIERYAYNEQGLLAQIQPPADGHPIALGYDLWGRLTRREHAGLTLGFVYDVAGRLTELINENAARSRFAWDVMDRLVREEGFDGRRQRYHWDRAGQLSQSQDGRAHLSSTTRYRWDDAGRLIERLLPANAHGVAQSHRYEWSSGGQLRAASVWLLPPEREAQQQSRIEFERDGLGRLTGERQTLYRLPGADAPPEASAEPEFEHHIAHQLDALGNRRQSQLQGIGCLDWLTYGSGHLHGVLFEQRALIDLERDRLHRETQRHLHGEGTEGSEGDAAAPAALHGTRQWDALGRLEQQTLDGLERRAEPPEVLIGALRHRHYRYDALGQLIALESGERSRGHAHGTLPTRHYRYDGAGRLRGLREGEREAHWAIDPAGNRLPGAGAATLDQGPWAERVQAHWKQHDFNLLGDEVATNAHGPVTRWPDNRIGHSAEALWRYDGYGNRIEEERRDGSRQRLSYDSAHQLTRLSTQPPRPKPDDSPAERTRSSSSSSTTTTTSHYTYDALGRRLNKEVITAHDADASTSDIHYHGWDGDRLIHTEHLDPEHPGERQITHTVYEPQSFTPMLRLSTRGKAAAKPHRLVQALQESADGPEDEAALASLQAALQALPASMQQSLNEATTQALEQGLPAPALTMLGDAGPATRQHLQRMKKRLHEEEQQQKPPVEIHFYHCDHLGTPIALTDRNHHVIWAAKLDPWGNLEEEYNPNRIDQPIRLPGQHHDRETGLYYNRHRYYDPSLGSYISQDPIGLRGGTNVHNYAQNNPILITDPRGLYGTTSCAYYGEACNATTGIRYSCAAQYISKIFPTGTKNGWWQCVRQCLQEEHKRREKECCVLPNYVNDNVITDHTTCFVACAENSSAPGFPKDGPERAGDDVKW